MNDLISVLHLRLFIFKILRQINGSILKNLVLNVMLVFRYFEFLKKVFAVITNEEKFVLPCKLARALECFR